MTLLGGVGGEGFPFPLILDQDQGSEVFLALSIWQKCPVWDTKTSIKFLAAQEVSKTLDYSRLYYRHKIKSPLIRSENLLNFIQNGLIKVRQKPKRLQVQRKHELSKVVLAFEFADMSDKCMKTSLSKALKQEILNWLAKPKTNQTRHTRRPARSVEKSRSVKVHFHCRVILTCVHR